MKIKDPHHLCETCFFDPINCGADPLYGTEFGGENVIECSEYDGPLQDEADDADCGGNCTL